MTEEEESKLEAVEGKELDLLRLAKARALARFQAEPSRVAREGLEAANKALEDYQARSGAEPAGGRVFENLNAVLKYLKEQGWQITYNTLKKRVEVEGLLKKHARAGGFRQRDVELFAGQCLRLTPEAEASRAAASRPVPVAEEAPGDAQRKIRAEADLKERLKEKLDFELAERRGQLVGHLGGRGGAGRAHEGRGPDLPQLGAGDGRRGVRPVRGRGPGGPGAARRGRR